MLARRTTRRMYLPVACDVAFASEGRGVGQPHFSRGEHLPPLPKFTLHLFPSLLLPLPILFSSFTLDFILLFEALLSNNNCILLHLLPHGKRSSQGLLRLLSRSQSLNMHRYSKVPLWVTPLEDQLVQQDCENFSATYGFRTELQQQVVPICSYIVNSKPQTVVFPWV